MKPTPPPWAVEDDRYWGLCIRAQAVAERNVLGQHQRLYVAHRLRNRANAYLMAAAPELLEELAHLVRLMEPLEKRGILHIQGLATLNGARAAIAKAEGPT